MQKDILIQELRTRVGEDDAKVISDKTFDGFAENYLSLFEKDDEITDDTWKAPVAALKMFAGQKRHDDKVFTERYKSEYEAQHQKDVDARIADATAKAIEEFKKTLENAGDKGGDGDGEGTKPDPKADDGMEERMRTFMENALKERDKQIEDFKNTIKELTESQKEREKTARIGSVKSALKQYLLDLKAGNEACIDDALDGIDYGDEPSLEDFKQTAVAAYEKRYKRYYGDGGKPFGGESAGGSGGGSGSIVKSHIERVQQQVKDAEDYAKETEARFAK